MILTTNITETEQAQAAGYLSSTLNQIEAATANLTRSQFNFRPTPVAWTIAGILEHMLLVEDYVLGPLQQQLAGCQDSSPEAPCQEVDDFIRQSFSSRLYKVEAPPFMHPTEKFSETELLERLRENNAKLLNLLHTGNLSRERRIPSMPLEQGSGGRYKTMDGYQWLLAIAAHNDRHTQQIIEWTSLSK